jgi:hypothetical protein
MCWARVDLGIGQETCTGITNISARLCKLAVNHVDKLGMARHDGSSGLALLFSADVEFVNSLQENSEHFKHNVKCCHVLQQIVSGVLQAAYFALSLNVDILKFTNDCFIGSTIYLASSRTTHYKYTQFLFWSAS